MARLTIVINSRICVLESTRGKAVDMLFNRNPQPEAAL